MRTQGKITHWNEQKGYGFITPSKGAKQVFVHVSDFTNRRKPPELNQQVTFSLSTDNQGRPCAVKVSRAGEKQPRTRKRSFFKILLAIGFIAAVGISMLLNKMHIYVFYLYLGVSTFTFLLYAKDKWAAKRDAWRTPEGTLQGLALIGGWPGALLAQQVFWHKSRKSEFQIVFWVMVLINAGAFIWLFTQDGSDLLRSLTSAIDNL